MKKTKASGADPRHFPTRLLREYARHHMAAGSSPADAEAEILATVERVARTIAPSFRFGYHATEDIVQQACLESLVVLRQTTPPKYDPRRPLANFLYTHLHHRLHNYRRKQFLRLERPCKCCDADTPETSQCRRRREWSLRNAAKRNIMLPIEIGSVRSRGHAEPGMSEPDPAGTSWDAPENSEMLRRIDAALPVGLRRDYLLLLDGKGVPRERRELVRAAVAAILGVEGEPSVNP